jgi:hypothetical protein
MESRKEVCSSFTAAVADVLKVRFETTFLESMTAAPAG